ncbi:S-layer homology domain-containing protein [Ructibacterium gallinarum]|uniref:S-layer homology domain-containing protein n=1 Tax=Ructibacterium gallinarum TaxID=2779355 RepID=A0A9D5R863_9FIRM|nr:S-layer homology domain-containing protein [Ructibacterium gallinarum]MBE5040076.1 S-layer homology domain-containing protein [Ructibacterium gallinarum]
MNKWNKFVFILCFVFSALIGTTAAVSAQNKLIDKSKIIPFATSVRKTLAVWENVQSLVNDNYGFGAGDGYYNCDDSPYLLFYLGDRYCIDEIDIFAGIDHTGLFRISVSDDADHWISVADTEIKNGKNNIVFAETICTGSWIKFDFVPGSGGKRMYFTEFDFYGTPVLDASLPRLIEFENITSEASSQAQSLSVDMEDGSTRYYGCESLYSHDGYLYSTWWTSEDNGAGTDDWILYDLGEINILDSMICYYSSANVFDADIYISNDKRTWTQLKTVSFDSEIEDVIYSGKKIKINLEKSKARYVKICKVSASEEADTWKMGEVCFLSTGTASTKGEFYRIKETGEEKTDCLLSGTIRTVKKVSSEKEEEGILFSGLYHTPTGALQNYNMKEIVLTPTPQDYSIDLSVDSGLTGLPDTLDVERVNFAKTAQPFVLSNSGAPLQPGAGTVPGNAIDDNMSTGVHSTGEWAWTFQLEFPQVQNVGSVVISFEENGYPINYRIMTSEDGETWDTPITVTGNTSGGTYYYGFDTRPAKYIRIRDDLAQVGVRQMTITNIDVYEISYSSDYEIRTFVLKKDGRMPLEGYLDILGNEEEHIMIPTASELILDGEIEVGMDGELNLDFPKEYDEEEPLLVYLEKNSQLLYMDLKNSGAYQFPLSFSVPNFSLGDTVTVGVSGAFCYEKSIVYDENFIWDFFQKELKNCSESELPELLEKYQTQIDSDYALEIQNFSQAEKAKIYSVVLNESAQSFMELKTAIDNKIKEILASRVTTIPSGGSGGGSGSFGGSGNRGGGSVLISQEDLTEMQNSSFDIIDKDKPFNDLKGFEWAEDSICRLYELKIINGVADKKFAPSEEVTRAQFVKMLILALDKDFRDDMQCDFEDVLPGSWEYPYIAAACQMGVVNGVSEKCFAPNAILTRQDAAVMLHRFLRYFHIEIPDGDSVVFSDELEISEYAAEAVKEIAKKGIMNGVGNNKFAPLESCNRAMAAKIVYAVL